MRITPDGKSGLATLPSKVAVGCLTDKTSLPLLAVSFCIIWSSAFVATKIGLHSAPPLFLACIRFLLAGPLMIMIALLLKHPFPIDIRSIMTLVLLGILNNTIYLGLTFFALQTVSASLVAVIASTNPILTAALAYLFLSENLTLKKTIGLILGFLGVIFIMQNRIILNLDDAIGIGAALLGVLAFVIGTIIYKKYCLHSSILTINGLQVLFGGLALLPIAIFTEDFKAVNFDPVFFASLFYLTIIVSIGGTLIWFWLLQQSSAGTVSSYHFLNPALGMVFGWLILGEQIIWSDYLGIIPITIGILLVTHSSNIMKTD